MSDTQAKNIKPISEDLLKILVCPVSKTPVTLSEDGTKLLCDCKAPKCPGEYPIIDGIPKMIVEG